MKNPGFVALAALTVLVAATPAHAGFRYLPVGAPASAAAAPAAEAVVEGFADQVPLAVALRQVLPRGTVFVVADDVDMAKNVSWQGGRPWRDVLDAALAPVGLRAEYSNNNVRIVKGGGIKLTPPIQLTPPVEGDDPIALAPNAYAPTQTATTYAPDGSLVVSGEVTSLDPNVSLGTSAGGLPPGTMALGTTPRSAPLDGSVVVGQDFNGQPKVSSLYEITSADADIKDEVARGVTGPAPSTVMLTDPLMPGAGAMPMMGNLAASAPLPAPTMDYTEPTDWNAQAGQTLHDVLVEWGARVNVEINWQAEYDYPIEASLASRGTFEEAVRTLLYGFRDASPQPVGRLHKNDALGQKVLLITTRGNTYEE